VWQPSSPGSEAPATPAESQPVGIKNGAVTVYPAITAAAFYDDNVFATNANRQADWAFVVRPELGFLERGANHAIEAHAAVEGRKYSRFSSEDQVNGAASLGGTFMLDKDTQLQAKASYLRAHEDRGSSESALLGAAFDKPVAYNQFNAAAALNKRYDRWWTSFGAAGQWINYENPTILGIPIDQSYRNGVISVATTRVGYVVAPLTSVFGEWAGNHRDFQVDIFDSWGYRAVGGILLEPGPGSRVKGEAFAGYMNQRYTGVTFLTVSTFTYGANLGWQFTPAATLTVGGRRDALESGLNGGVSLVESVIGARVDYRIAPKVVVGVGATYVVDEFYGAARTDRYLGPLASLKYFINPNVTLGFDYRNVSFDSSGLGVPTYARNVYMVSLNARL
jgi:hypothetical protein